MRLDEMRLEGRRALFISYNEMLGGLGQSQVLPYLRGLHRLYGVRFTLLSYERDAAFTPSGQAQCAALREELAAHGIAWHWLRYHQRPSLPATMYDVAAGVRLARKLITQDRIELIHARSHIPATIALLLKRSHNFKFIFDLRGLMAEEYVDAGHWQANNLPFRLIKNVERRAFAAADGVVTLTQAIWPIIKEWDGLRGRNVSHAVIPCCADLEKFQFRSADRATRRAELGLVGVNDRYTIVYSGSLDGWYMTAEMADFGATLLRQRPDAFFLWLTPNRHERVHELMAARGLTRQQYAVCAANPAEVPAYLCAADAGLAFIKPCFSKIASSPTKTAEYLGCGLPLVLNAGIGDSDTLITQEKAGALVTHFTADNYRAAVKLLQTDFATNNDTRTATRTIAERLFDLETVALPRYAALYGECLELRLMACEK